MRVERCSHRLFWSYNQAAYVFVPFSSLIFVGCVVNGYSLVYACHVRVLCFYTIISCRGLRVCVRTLSLSLAYAP